MMIDDNLEMQIAAFKEIVYENDNIKYILENNPFPDGRSWYLGAGCLCQTVWNYLSGRNVAEGIKDYDLIYYDVTDLSDESEKREAERIKKLFGHLCIEIDVVNEARVHLWFEKDFGKKIEQLKSCEDAIRHWPTTASSIGINYMNGKINVFAPYGLSDLLGMVVRQNTSVLSMNNYEEKINRWTLKWPNLRVVPWQKGNV